LAFASARFSAAAAWRWRAVGAVFERLRRRQFGFGSVLSAAEPAISARG